MCKKAKAAYEDIRKRIASSEVVGAKETECSVNGHKHGFHVRQTKALSYIVSLASRGHKVLEGYFPESFLQSFYVSDCWASPLKVPAKRHQLCIAHLLREVLNFEKSLNAQWRVSIFFNYSPGKG
ncbi:MAG: transposase [Tannerella sp.]|nr:transposase [Tannerella sp.]